MKLKLNRKIENKFYIGLFIVSGLLLITFFSSKVWMYDDSPIMQTPFYTEINGLDQTNLVLQKWEYNPKQHLMEVVLKTKHVGTDHIKPTFSFAAKERDSKLKIPVKVMYQDDENVVLQIRKVPEEFRYIGLFVRETRDPKIIENEMKKDLATDTGTVNPEEETRKFVQPKPTETVVVGDYRKIKLNKHLKTNSNLAYQKEQIMLEIKQVKKEILALQNDNIPLQDQLISSIQGEIKTINNEIKYKTEEEKQDAYAQIVSLQEAIKEAEKSKSEYESQVQRLKEKQVKLYEKLKDVELKTVKKSVEDKTKGTMKTAFNKTEE